MKALLALLLCLALPCLSVVPTNIQACCQGRTGDANNSGDEEPTIGDINALIVAIYVNASCDGVIECLAEADVNQSGGPNPTCEDITIGDITYLVQYLYVKACSGGYFPCPPEDDLPPCFPEQGE